VTSAEHFCKVKVDIFIQIGRSLSVNFNAKKLQRSEQCLHPTTMRIFAMTLLLIFLYLSGLKGNGVKMSESIVLES
jgi:hypothetical protein